MPMSHFPNGFNHGVSIREVPILNSYGSANVWWVDSNAAYAGDGTYTRPLLTIDAAINLASANDIIMVKPGHAETLSTASAITADVDGVAILGFGQGAEKPTLTFSNTAATVVVSGASVTMDGFVITPSVDSVVSPIVVSGANCWLRLEHRDASATVECVRSILTTAGADNLTVKLQYKGFTGGNAVVNAIRLVGVDNADIDVSFYGVASTSVVEFHTTACTNIKVNGQTYNSGTTNGSKNVVDTVTGSTWYAVIEDQSAGATYTGGSASALASDDVSSVSTAVTTIDGYHDVPGADSTDNNQMRDVIGNKTDAAATGAVSATESLMAYGKQAVTELQVIDGYHDVPGADSTDNNQLRDVLGNKTDAAAAGAVSATESLMAYSKQLVTEIQLPSANNTDNAFIRDVIGQKADDAGLGAPGATKTMMRYIKQVVNQTSLGQKVTRNAADVFDGTTTALFTVSGGRVLVTHLEGEVVGAAVDATNSTTKFTMNPTVGTDRDLCATLDIISDEEGSIYTITGVASDGLQGGSGGGAPGMTNKGVVCPEGTIDLVSSADAGTGGAQGKFELWFLPLDDNATVAAA